MIVRHAIVGVSVVRGKQRFAIKKAPFVLSAIDWSRWLILMVKAAQEEHQHKGETRQTLNESVHLFCRFVVLFIELFLYAACITSITSELSP